jgi:hypothetical protein
VRERESDGARARARAREESEEASRPRGIDCSWLIVVVGPDWESGSGTIEPGLALRLLPFAQPLPVTGAAAPKAASSRRPRAIPGPGRLSGRARCALRLDRQQRALAGSHGSSIAYGPPTSVGYPRGLDDSRDRRPRGLDSGRPSGALLGLHH